MKILIISDSHDNIANLKAVMEIARKTDIKAVIHCGDWTNVESVLSFGIPLYTVLGNGDVRLEVIKKLELRSKKFGTDFLVIELGGRKIGFTHKPGDVKRFFGGKKLDIIFCGHYHSKDETFLSGTKVVRPGAIMNGINFAVYETITNGVEFIEENKLNLT